MMFVATVHRIQDCKGVLIFKYAKQVRAASADVVRKFCNIMIKLLNPPTQTEMTA